MNNDSWICFECRESYRRSAPYDKDVNCAKCNHACHNIGHKINVPKKSNIKAWKKLMSDISSGLVMAQEHSTKEEVRMAHDLEQGETHLDILTTSKNRAAAIKKINKQLKKRSM